MRGAFRVGRIFGIDFVIDFTWPIIGFLVAWGMYADAIGHFGSSQSRGVLLVVSVSGSVLFFASVVAHELGHALMAGRRGIRTVLIRLFVLGGLAEIEREATSPGDELAIAIAGPITSAVAGGLFLGVAWLLPEGAAPWERAARFVGFANLILSVFNLAPGFPLDGGRVLRAVVWRVTGDHDRATRVAATAGKGLALVLAAAGAYLVFFVREIGGLWWLAIAWFLYQAAAAALVQTRAFAVLQGVAAGDVMTAVSLVVDAECSLEDFNTEFVLASRFTAFPVREEDRIRGLIGRQELRSVPRERWGSVSVGDVMQVLAPADVMDVTAPLEDVFRRIPHGESRVAIVEEGRFVGIVSEDELDRWARNSVSPGLKPV